MKPIDYAGRIAKIRQSMANSSLDVLVATKLSSLSYILGEFACWRSAAIIPLEGNPSETVVATTTSIDSSRLAYGTWVQDVRPWELAMRFPTFSDVISDVIKGKGLANGTIGLEFDNFTALEYEQMKAKLPNATFCDASAIVDNIMVVKEPQEIELIRRACEIADIGMKAGFEAVKVGVTECEVAGAVEYAIRMAGSEWSWSVTSGTEVGSGYRTAFLRGWTEPATRKRIQYGDFVTIDVHPMYELYVSDLCLNAIVGEPTKQQRELEKVWKDTVVTLIDNTRAGVVIADIAKAARSVVRKAGYEEYCSTLLGHGLGTWSSIPPIVSEVNTDVIQPNTVLELVVNITKPGVGGMRLELPVLVKENETEALCKTPIDLVVV